MILFSFPKRSQRVKFRAYSTLDLTWTNIPWIDDCFLIEDSVHECSLDVAFHV